MYLYLLYYEMLCIGILTVSVIRNVYSTTASLLSMGKMKRKHKELLYARRPLLSRGVLSYYPVHEIHEVRRIINQIEFSEVCMATNVPL